MEEEIDVVNEDDEVIARATRKKIRNEALLHRIIKVILVNKNGEMLVHKRSSSKDMFPSYWDLSCAETVRSGEGYEEAASRGLKEELGINISTIELAHAFQFRFKYRSKNHNANFKVYSLLFNDPIKIQKEEVDEAKFLPIKEIADLIKYDNFHTAAAAIFEKYLQLKEIKF